MSAHTTWRVAFNASRGNQYVQLSEMAFLDASGADLSVGGAAAASSEFSATYSAAKLFDKNPATDWCTVSGAIPAWAQYAHAAAVDAAFVRIIFAGTDAWLPLPNSMYVSASDDGVTFGPAQRLLLADGVIASTKTAIFKAWPADTPLLGVLQSTQRGIAAVVPGTIAINNRVMVKAGPTDPETPMAGARVRLHRKQDGVCVWQGISDASGYYHASGLEVGATYIPVAIDPSGAYECVAAGPVVAVKA